VVREEVARNSNVFVAETEVRPQEDREEPNHLGIGVREPNLVPVSCTFSPVQHAPCHVDRIAVLGYCPAMLLSRDAVRAMTRCIATRSIQLAVVRGIHSPKLLRLFSRQLYVPDPVAHGGLGDADTPRDLVDR
jgi:hypothetical protein